MNHKLMIVMALGVLAPATAAHADAVAERVMLQPGAAGCPSGSTGFYRIKQMPDGSQIKEGEFVVPSGAYLEITSIEYTTPYYMEWAKFFAQSISVDIRQRGGSQSTNVLTASYGTGSMYYEDKSEQYKAMYQFAGQGPSTTVASFPVGPLMSTAGRLCVTAKSEFYSYGGAVRVRGRLIPSATLKSTQPGGGVLQP